MKESSEWERREMRRYSLKQWAITLVEIALIVAVVYGMIWIVGEKSDISHKNGHIEELESRIVAMEVENAILRTENLRMTVELAKAKEEAKTNGSPTLQKIQNVEWPTPPRTYDATRDR